MAQLRDLRKVQLIIIITIMALIVLAYLSIRFIQKKRAKKVDNILNACMEDPYCIVDKHGNVENGDGNGNGDGDEVLIDDGLAWSKAKALVDDLWGWTIVVNKPPWRDFKKQTKKNYCKIVAKANIYIHDKDSPSIGSKPSNFYDLLGKETSWWLNSGHFQKRIVECGLN